MSDFEVNSKRQIIAFLSAMRDKNQLLDVKVSGSNVAGLSTIVDIDENNGTLIIDKLKDDKLQERILNAQSVDAEGFLDHIKISFTTDVLEFTSFNGSDAIALSLPDSIIRLQRREFYRVPTPVINPVKCRIPASSWNGPSTLDLPLKNISSGGILIADEKMQIDASVGKIFRSCVISIPGGDSFVADLELRNSLPTISASGHMGSKIGFKFIKIDGKSANILQKYINKLELEQRSIKH